MPNDMNPVANNPQESAPADAMQAPAAADNIQLPEYVPEENTGDSLSAMLSEAPEKKPPTDSGESAPEPSWYKKRLAKDLNRAIAENNAEWERRLAPLYESVIEREAEALVRSGEIKSIERAKEFVRLKNGTAPAPDKTPPAQKYTPPDTGRTPDTVDPTVRAHAEILMSQANKIKANGGPDVLAAYRANPEIAQRVNSREWDFRDVAEYLSKAPRAPSPMRSTNGAAVQAIDIMHMSKEAFDRLDRGLQEGKRYDVRK